MVKKLPKGKHNVIITNVEKGAEDFPLITFKAEKTETAELLIASNMCTGMEIWKETPHE